MGFCREAYSSWLCPFTLFERHFLIVYFIFVQLHLGIFSIPLYSFFFWFARCKYPFIKHGLYMMKLLLAMDWIRWSYFCHSYTDKSIMYIYVIFLVCHNNLFFFKPFFFPLGRREREKGGGCWFFFRICSCIVSRYFLAQVSISCKEAEYVFIFPLPHFTWSCLTGGFLYINLRSGSFLFYFKSQWRSSIKSYGQSSKWGFCHRYSDREL